MFFFKRNIKKRNKFEKKKINKNNLLCTYEKINTCIIKNQNLYWNIKIKIILKLCMFMLMNHFFYDYYYWAAAAY